MQPKSKLQRVTAALVATFLIAVLSPAVSVWATSAGPNLPSLGEDVPGVGIVTWTLPENITTPGMPSVATLHSLQTSHYLRATSYRFAIPSGSTIQGITVTINRQASNPDTPNIRDYQVRLVKDGVITGTDKAKTETDWPYANFAIATYGGPDDLWGTTWTVEDINASDFGVVLSVTNPNTTIVKAATVDTIQITINYTLPGTTTSVYCGSGTPSVPYTSSIECVATVTRVAGSNTPSGSVSWTTSDSGTFTTSPCTLSGSAGTASCSVSYTPSAVGDGWHNLTATYAGDLNFTSSSGTEGVTVNKGTAVLTVTNSPVIYNGSPQAAQIGSSTPGVISNKRYNGSLTVPTQAGTYAVTANFVPTDTFNFLTLTSASAGDFIIEKATPTLSVDNSPVLYDGTPKIAVVTVSADGTVSQIRYDGLATPPTEVGTYAVTADFAPTDTRNYCSLTGTLAGYFVIEYEHKIFVPLISAQTSTP